MLRELADTTIASGDAAAAAITGVDADVAVADEWLGTRDGATLLAWACQTGAAGVGILLGGSPASVAAAQRDGFVLLPKLVDPDTLRTVCTLALESAALRRRLRGVELERGLRRPPLPHPPPDLPAVDGLERYEGLLYRSAAMQNVVKTLRSLEASDVSVLVQGETGTGKEVVARAIHARSRRRGGPFLPINLGAIPDGLRESELFGHVRGAFTGAMASRTGLFLGADGGTLFLDEVGEASAPLQVAFLRVLEEAAITPVGADRPRRIDVRIVSATNQPLAQLVRDGRFRRDLYYRLNVYPVRLPSLRERVEDVVPLALHFLARASRALGREPATITPEARAALEASPWEGNVRELRSVMERAAVVCAQGVVQAGDLLFSAESDEPPAGRVDAVPVQAGATFRDMEREILLRTLALAGGNRSQAARMLGLHESTLRFRLRRGHRAREARLQLVAAGERRERLVAPHERAAAGARASGVAGGHATCSCATEPNGPGGPSIPTLRRKRRVTEMMGRISNTFAEESGSPARITVVGVGGGGGNAVSRMIDAGLQGVKFVSVNTDLQALWRNRALNKIQIGEAITNGLGAGANPDVGRRAATDDTEKLCAALDGSEMVFITAGLGGGTGTGAAPVVASIANRLGGAGDHVLTVAVVTLPFALEGKRRMEQARAGLEELKKYADAVIAIPNDRVLQSVARNTPVHEAFSVADDVLLQAVQGITDIIIHPGQINVDFADVRSIMKGMGHAVMGIGMGEGQLRALTAAQRAVSNPLLENSSMQGARSIVVNITGGPDLSLAEASEATSFITRVADPDANVIYGIVTNENMRNAVRVTVIATGFENEPPAKAEPESEVAKRPNGIAPARAKGNGTAESGDTAADAGRRSVGGFFGRMWGRKVAQA